LSYSDIKFPELPAERLQSKLQALENSLEDKGITAKMVLYPLYDKKLFGLEEEESVRNPLFISCYHVDQSIDMMIVEYDPWKDQYRLSEVFRIEDASLLIHSYSQITIKRNAA